jgi:hypothetical protein
MQPLTRHWSGAVAVLARRSRGVWASMIGCYWVSMWVCVVGLLYRPLGLLCNALLPVQFVKLNKLDEKHRLRTGADNHKRRVLHQHPVRFVRLLPKQVFRNRGDHLTTLRLPAQN